MNGFIKVSKEETVKLISEFSGFKNSNADVIQGQRAGLFYLSKDFQNFFGEYYPLNHRMDFTVSHRIWFKTLRRYLCPFEKDFPELHRTFPRGLVNFSGRFNLYSGNYLTEIMQTEILKNFEYDIESDSYNFIISKEFELFDAHKFSYLEMNFILHGC